VACLSWESNDVIIGQSSYTTISDCAAQSNSQGGFIWVETAADQLSSSFDLTTAQSLITLTLVAFAFAYSFRMLRDMILNRR